MTDEYAIETEDLVKVYDGTTVVDHLNLRVRKNEVFGLLGPNGAGKTTSILMMLGLTEPSSGMVRVSGFNPTREPLKVKRIVGYLPENVGFYENLTARENLRFIADLNSIEYHRAERRIEEVLAMVGLSDETDTIAGNFSKGMKQRLGIADVLVKEPELVFLDEPTSGLDPAGINQLLDLIAALPGMGTTVLLSSHQLYQVQRVCQSVGILSKGKLVIGGSLDELGRDVLAGGRYLVEVETDGTSQPLVAILQGMDGVERVEASGNTLKISTRTDIRSAISRAIADSDISLVEMKVHEFSLDEIYMKYFKES